MSKKTVEELASLSDEELRVMCAELCGIRMELCSCGKTHRDLDTRRHIPNYPADLNAMAEAEKALDEVPNAAWHSRYVGALAEMCHDTVWTYRATARQRCIAFLFTKQQSQP